MNSIGYEGTIDQANIDGALRALIGLEEIEANQMMKRGFYLTDQVVNPLLAKAGAVCGGHQACYVGSLWLGAGVQYVKETRCIGYEADENGDYIVDPATGDWTEKTENYWTLPDVGERDRYAAFLVHPGLELAYDASNVAADAYFELHPEVMPNLDHGASCEALFESRSFGQGGPFDEQDLYDAVRQVVAEAKASVRDLAAENKLNGRRRWKPQPVRARRRSFRQWLLPRTPEELNARA